MESILSPIWVSLKTATVATIITFFLGILIARLMVDYRGKGKNIIDGLLIIPLVLPPTVIGFGLLLIFGRNGPVGKILEYFGYHIIFSWPATVIAAFIVSFPLMYQTARGAFEQIDPNLVNAARILGDSEWNIFWRVIIPLSWPSIMAGTTLSFARALGEFGATLMLAGNIPGKTQTIPIAIYFAVAANQMERALIWVSLILIIALTTIVGLNYWRSYQLKQP
ncbi:MAG: molybdate ABC transporter permease subunit [Clostridia bacterium]|jgi:molybdate transport system permease protein|nr:molybdate ABC transporter permease subunit [Clostridia bacterium]